MATKKQHEPQGWKLKDFLYGLLGLAVGFFISFMITNSVQRDTVVGRTATNTAAQQTAQLPPDHPPVDSGATEQATTPSGDLPPGHPPVPDGATTGPAGPMGMPPPLPSLEPRSGPGPKAEDVFKDIEVLKGLPPDEFQRAMGIITVSLGVDCNYCHVPGSFESPHPKKEIARTMIRMVKDINKNYVGGKVNCYTCHRGSPKPPTQ